MDTIFIIDDEPNIVELARLYLEREGYKVVSSASGIEAINQITLASPSLIILDIMLPDIDGFEVLKRLRRFSQVPVLMLSARREDIDKIVGLESGADDYLTKPFNPHELLARVKALLRRSNMGATPEVIKLGGLDIDIAGRQVTADSTVIPLRHKEFTLLLTLVRQPGVVFSRETLLNKVWGYDYYGDTRTVDVHINHLRTKLEDTGIEIETLRGIGYKVKAVKEIP
ncbi:MAG: response regulator transcription factor [Dehalogenimonas sp.]|uniref:Response regulator transcription factor n=1 Tax=Candidatus Dehalogenimonas loeffleri TaxID=3127115 RepID=A0ABZ2J4Z2_9CHLR|nr:response regulator transcription factor [Dehalogenimonas sp.]